MKLAISHIAWAQEEEPQALKMLEEIGFTGLEIAPSRVAGIAPYEEIEKAQKYAEIIKNTYNMQICSMQSIWYGQKGNMFGEEREHFLQYTRQAILFASAVGAKNLVFGCPKNRILKETSTVQEAVSFFRQLGDFAAYNGTTLALEANPPIYGTNFMNTTAEAIEMCKMVDSTACRLNLDFGTIIINSENIEDLRGQVKHINHVHISEPELAEITPRKAHAQLAALLKEEGYAAYISIEMRQQKLDIVEKAAKYIMEVFGG